MGCGKQSGRGSIGIVVVSSVLERSYLGNPQLAGAIEVKNELAVTEPVKALDEKNKEFYPRLGIEPRGSLGHAKDSLFDVSKISGMKEEEGLKRDTLRYRSPTDVVKKIEENNPGVEINFDFLNESSRIVNKGKGNEESLDVEILG